MGTYEKLIFKILTGRSDNIKFQDICNLLLRLGFMERVRGGHHIFYRDNVDEIVNLQSKGGKAKNYQLNKLEN